MTELELIQHYYPELTKMQRNVAILLMRGLTNKQAAIELKLSSRTIETHRFEIYRRLGVRSIVELVHKIYTDRAGVK